MNAPRTCSLCGNNGHNSRTCPEGDGGGASGAGGFMLFGVRLTTTEGSSSFRKSVSMNNLSQFDQPLSQDSNNADAGYASDDVVHPSDRCRSRKRGIPWTEEEHRLFLLGLQKVGKGDWRGISRNFVKTRTPTQVASHAQKYFLRRNNFNRRRRRSSLFDITTDTFPSSSMEDDLVFSGHEALPPPLPPSQPLKDNKPGNFLLKIHPVKPLPPAGDDNNAENTISSKILRPIPMLPLSPYPKFAQLNINDRTPEDPLPLTLKLSTSHPEAQSPTAASQSSSNFQTMSGGGDSIDIVSVA
ncbi:transcription factor MYB1R1 [Cucurbita pepo subsp. pepo]|uniref:transcription factor MYB1R1 n=1 Tax=Cucurbita pepo subsp. pepo TaxID=3664 RepID=UPI000C9D4D6C|nr:transcription factor MYB1R1 [Cucurbita pepo subsp. pepo]